jgi:hypothetical protein
MTDTTDTDLAQALREIVRMGVKFDRRGEHSWRVVNIAKEALALHDTARAQPASAADIEPMLLALTRGDSTVEEIEARQAIRAAFKKAQPASEFDCEHVWVEYVQPVYKSASAGDLIRPGENGVKRYENLGFMCDKCGVVKPPQPASVADGWVMVPREPTQAMLTATMRKGTANESRSLSVLAYQSMLAAAPQPPAPAQEVCPTCGGSKVDPGGLPVCRDCGDDQ